MLSGKRSGSWPHSFKSQIFPPKTVQEVRALIVSGEVRATSKVERVLRFALEHPAEIAFGTARGLASRCGVSNATIARAALLFGFRNFHDFRELFRMEVRRVRSASDCPHN
jgi:DNA-binding MurR/RpiR family transcriptional regulator